MNSNAIPNKNVELSSLQASSMTMRRLFILVDGKRTLGELAKLCHIEEGECESLIQQLVANGSLTAEGFSVDESTVASTDESEESIIIECSGFLDCLTKELSLYIGPVAQIITKKSGADNSSLPLAKMLQIVETVSKEIEKTEDKTAFIETMNERINQK